MSGDIFSFSNDISTAGRESRRCGAATMHAAAGGIRFPSPMSPVSCISGGGGDTNSGGAKALRYKTELCRAYEENGCCRYGDKCQFAHGIGELRSLLRHPKYKTDLCKTFHTTGFCPYGARCHFIHGDCKDSAASTLNSTDARVSNVGRLLSSLDDELLMALASLIQRRQDGSPASAQSVSSTCSFVPRSWAASAGTPSPCPSPSSVTSSGGVCSPGCGGQFIYGERRLNDSGCVSPNDGRSYSSSWISSSVADSSSHLSPSNCVQRAPSNNYLRSVSFNKVARSIFA